MHHWCHLYRLYHYLYLYHWHWFLSVTEYFPSQTIIQPGWVSSSLSSSSSLIPSLLRFKILQYTIYTIILGPSYYFPGVRNSVFKLSRRENECNNDEGNTDNDDTHPGWIIVHDGICSVADKNTHPILQQSLVALRVDYVRKEFVVYLVSEEKKSLMRKMKQDDKNNKAVYATPDASSWLKKQTVNRFTDRHSDI